MSRKTLAAVLRLSPIRKPGISAYSVFAPRSASAYECEAGSAVDTSRRIAQPA